MNRKRFWTGERLETFVNNASMLEHLHRYALALEIIENKNVLDIACGVGYGTNLMAQKALKVTGIDIDDDTIKQAKLNYKKENIIFKCGSILNIPENEMEFDIIICFETIEHISNHLEALKELKRVLKPGGILLISTPDKENYSDKYKFQNPFHEKELYKDEFKSILENHFKNVSYYKQTEITGSIITSETEENKVNRYYSGNYTKISSSNCFERIYQIAIASDKNIINLGNSIFFHENKLEEILKMETDVLKKTITYRIGHLILYPAKLIFSIFKK